MFAKVKGLRKKPYFKLISDHTLFDEVKTNITHCIEYNPDHNLDEDAWFKIEKFSKQEFCIELIKSAFDSKNFDDLDKSQFAKIGYLFSVQGGNFYFQKVTPSLFLKRKMIGFGEAIEVEEGENRIIVNSLPDAVYFKGYDTLIFKNLASISSIFKGIDELYKEATNDQVQKFLDEEFLNLTGDLNLEKVSKPNRKRIALALDTLNQMNANQKDLMLSYVHSYCDKKLTFDGINKKFEIKSDEELKLLLYGIEQRFYTTALSNQKRLANSVIDL